MSVQAGHQFLVFAGTSFYPGGGWKDYRGSAKTFGDALQKVADMRCDWYQIVNLKTGEMQEGKRR